MRWTREGLGDGGGELGGGALNDADDDAEDADGGAEDLDDEDLDEGFGPIGVCNGQSRAGDTHTESTHDGIKYPQNRLHSPTDIPLIKMQ